MRKSSTTTINTKQFSPNRSLIKGRFQECITTSLLGLGMLSSLEPLNAQDDVSLIQQEIKRRSNEVKQAQELLKTGDLAYRKSDFKGAVTNYSKAFENIPKANLTHKLRFAAGDRYAQAVVEYSKVLARTGQYAIAKKHLNAVLNENVAPGNVGAMKMLAKLDDPVRYSPTLTLEHVRKIEKVAHGLRKAESFFLLAKYDEALIAYEDVLSIDETNKAARRGMERVASAISNYGATAKDYTRAKALMEVDAMWELKPRPKLDFSTLSNSDVNVGDRIQDIRGNKLKQIIVPTVDFDDATFNEVINTIRIWARELDTTELDPEKKGVNLVARFGDDASGFKTKIEATRINLKLKNVPLNKILDYVCKQSEVYWRSEQFAVVLRPRGAFVSELMTRTFRVPKGFLDQSDDVGNENVFEDGAVNTGKLSAQKFLEKAGMPFPDGTSVFYNKGNNTLKVTNSSQVLDSIEELITAQAINQNVLVVVKTTIIEIAERKLNELGYDWLVDPVLGKNSVFVTGGTQGNGNLIGPEPSLIGGTAVAGNAITSGNRSGDSMFTGNSLDDRIAGITGATTRRAPSPLSFTSEVNNSRYQAIIRALSQKKDNARLTQSTAVTSTGKRVELISSRELIYPSEYEPGEVPQGVAGGSGVATPAFPTAFEKRDLGYKLSIEPTVSEDKSYIDLTLEPNIVSLDGFINYGNPIFSQAVDPLTGLPSNNVIQTNEILMPVFRNFNMNTTVTIKDGATVVLGGLVQQKIENVEDKTPILGDLPLVGRFFQSKGLQNTKTAIIVFVNVELLDPTGHKWRDR